MTNSVSSFKIQFSNFRERLATSASLTATEIRISAIFGSSHICNSAKVSPPAVLRSRARSKFVAEERENNKFEKLSAKRVGVLSFDCYKKVKNEKKNLGKSCKW